MKTYKVIFRSFIVIIALAIGFLLNGNFDKKVLAATDKPVELYCAYFPYTQSYYTRNMFGDICVKNLGYNKKVTVHYYSAGKWWEDQAKYVKNNSDGTEVWTFSAIFNYTESTEFAIKYEVNGQTYWDNNNGENYKISMNNNPFIFGKSNITLDKSFSWNTSLYSCGDENILKFRVRARKISDNGTIKVRYTEDNWDSYKDYAINYNGRDYGVNIYKAIEIPISKDTNKVDFAICNEVDGVEYWDNNFGQNYTAVLK